jgi:hypothetical protein
MFGVSILLNPVRESTSFVYIESQLHIPVWTMGWAFILSGLLMGLAINKWLYLLGIVLLLLIALAAFIGSLSDAVPVQAAIAYGGLFACALCVFPEDIRGH